MTVSELINTINQNCPPNSPDPIVVLDNLTGEIGPVINVRYRHNGKGMVLELVVQGDK